MNNKLQTVTLVASLACLSSVNAATVLISNANDGLTDTLYTDSNNVPLSIGIVSTGYFASTITQADIDTIPELFALLGSFTTITSQAFGQNSGTLEGTFAGYADQFPNAATDIGNINVGNLLFGRKIYTIVTNATALTGVGGATATSGFALFQSGTLSGDDPNVIEITVIPPSTGEIIGAVNPNLTGNLGGQGSLGSNYGTLSLVAVPEPSTALLGALGVLALLRRRR